jgi:hypothetical protein
MQKANKRPGKPRPSKAKHRKAAREYTAANMYHWHRRILKEMKQSQRVVDLVVAGAADEWLK